ncbi:hypothetical protein PIB19_10790 [Sphingomonas sp. 7/4-4]|uniref:hypothetical protein n=1 Tax=Sphingomonas sp. 7/4-4 TaxID=3018446 RepID=UPI0022F3E157|nr:hypothetical protein [Sphingomonas sp. 7/4-4]WBY09720.1 hypothetical protein PIB19_10790 [Sphingomonas sp. 7/4-4]
MQWKRVTRLGTMSGALALSACMMPYDGGPYEAPPPVYSADESPDAYSYIDRADSLWEVIGNAPPDYAFSFEDAEPWAWELQDGDSIIVEETPDGIQSYYFGPEGEGPFLAVRPGMSFGFSGETVAVVYGPDGGALPREEGAANLEEGVALYARGRQLRRAMQQRQWREVDSQAWIDTGPLIWSSIQIWGEGRSRHSGWRRHHEQWRDADWRRRSEAEQLRRRALAEQFRRWREGGFQGPPPGRFHRPGEHGPGAGRPGRPGEPGTRPPRQPGQWGRPGRPWAGRPGAGQATPTIPRGPRWPNKPGVDAPEPPVTDTPQTAPTPVPGAGCKGAPAGADAHVPTAASAGPRARRGRCRKAPRRARHGLKENAGAGAGAARTRARLRPVRLRRRKARHRVRRGLKAAGVGAGVVRMRGRPARLRRTALVRRICRGPCAVHRRVRASRALRHRHRAFLRRRRRVPRRHRDPRAGPAESRATIRPYRHST